MKYWTCRGSYWFAFVLHAELATLYSGGAELATALMLLSLCEAVEFAVSMTTFSLNAQGKILGAQFRRFL